RNRAAAKRSRNDAVLGGLRRSFAARTVADAMRLNLIGSCFTLHGDCLSTQWTAVDGTRPRRIAERHLRNNSRIVRWPFLLAHAIGRAHSWASASTGSAPRSRNSL